MPRFRIIPATIAVTFILLCVKVIDVTQGTEALAQNTPAPPASMPVPDKASSSAAAMAPASTSASAPASAKPAETKTEMKEGKKEPVVKNAAVSETAGDTVDHRYTPVELELLQNLVHRREELDRWEKNIEVKEQTLEATEKRLNDTIDQISSMKSEVSTLLSQYNEIEDAKIKSLVKIYEAMKPKDAARIFDEVEMPILLLVIDKMAEKKIAPILSLMDPKKAKMITVQLAEERRISSQRINFPPSSAPNR